VALLDMDAGALDAAVAALTADGAQAMAVQASVTDADAVARDFAQVAETWGGIDGLVNNAGIFLAGHISDNTLDDYERTMHVNVRAPFVAIQAVQSAMPDGGRIINI
ncbi:SDR family oxidoreductase, partial [Paenibacillus polymyxa]|nr:SDR family oxidoreductase [Paenibacillus polymyxa]